MPPGLLVHVGDNMESVIKITLVDYNSSEVEIRQLEHIGQLVDYSHRDSVTWVIIEGLSDVEIVDQVGSMFDVHQLVLEDILNTHLRPKFEDYEDYLFIVLKSLLRENQQQFKMTYELVSLLVTRNLVFTFKDKKDDIFKPVIKRIRTGEGRLRTLGAEYLAYAILDSITDQCFTLSDFLDDGISALEDDLLKDVSDHGIRVIESIELHRDIPSGLLDIYISSVSNKMNEVTKVLTLFASIFIPLAFSPVTTG